MNEQIVELLKQVGGIQYDEDGDELTPILVGKDLEKFARLIIKECAEVSANEFLMKVYKGPHQAHAARQAVLKHFGVEE